MKKTYWVLFLVVALLIAAAVPAFAAGPNFGAAIYADGQVWGTKGNPEVPAPNDHNRQSFDGLYTFPNGEQLPIAEAAPGNPDYNGGRWIKFVVTWNVTPPEEPITSYADLMALGDDVTITPAPEEGRYFQCPLLPAKDA